MPKFPTFPTLYDDVLKLNISHLKRDGFFVIGKIHTGVTTWTVNGKKTGQISIKADARSEQPFVELDYNYRDEPRHYKINLVSVPSNLGKGKIWYFLCPHTGKRCRKLYSIGGYFLHREAFKGCMYESQTQSKYYRRLEKSFGAYCRLDKLYNKLYSKHFKSHYDGKPTKCYLKIMKEIKEGEKVTPAEFENALIGNF